MPTVPPSGTSLGDTSPSIMNNPSSAPSTPYLQMAAATMSQMGKGDPQEIMPKGEGRPRLPARKMTRKLKVVK